MKKRNFIIAALLLCAILMLRIPARADFGNFSGSSDYDYDYDSSGWSSSSDYDYDYDYDYDDDDRYSRSSSGGLFWFILLAVILYSVFVSGKKGKGKKSGKRRSAQSRQVRSATGSGDRGALKPIGEYTKLDPNFSSAALCEKVSNLYVQMQNGWTAKDIEPLRPYFTDALFTQMERALQDIDKRGETNVVERIAVLDVTPRGFRQSGGEDIITLRLRTRITDYTVNDSTQAVVSGSREKEKFMTYEWDLLRPSGITTGADGDTVKRISCPGCGAPLDLNASARCPYCGSVIRQQAQDWVISAIRGIKQETR